MTLTPADFTSEDTLIAIMIAVSASDEAIRTSELVTTERMVNHLPVFAEDDIERIRDVSNTFFDLLADEGAHIQYTCLSGCFRYALWVVNWPCRRMSQQMAPVCNSL